MPEVPSWLVSLTEAVSASLTVHGPQGDLGLSYREADGIWDVLVYPLPLEMIGGAHDGGLAALGFEVDLDRLRAAFDRVAALAWDALGTSSANADEGPCVSVEGEVAGRKIWLRVLAYAPDGVGTAAKIDPDGRRVA
jgi:hypothetical protein